MSKASKDDATSIGAILVSMGTITEEDLHLAIHAQQNSSIEQLLGNQLVVMGLAKAGQVNLAMAAQKAMRSGSYERSMAVVDIAIARKKRTCAERRQVNARGKEVARKTGQDHVAITDDMLKR